MEGTHRPRLRKESRGSRMAFGGDSTMFEDLAKTELDRHTIGRPVTVRYALTRKGDSRFVRHGPSFVPYAEYVNGCRPLSVPSNHTPATAARSILMVVQSVRSARANRHIHIEV